MKSEHLTVLNCKYNHFNYTERKASVHNYTKIVSQVPDYKLYLDFIRFRLANKTFHENNSSYLGESFPKIGRIISHTE